MFDSPDGKVTLADLFDGRSQLAVYHFMLTPGKDHICPGCSFVADHVDGARQHFEHADLSFAAISRAPLSTDRAGEEAHGLAVPLGVVERQRLQLRLRRFVHAGAVRERHRDLQLSQARLSERFSDGHGTSIFARNGKGEMFHTYSTYARGDEVLLGAFSWLDLTPKGRNEDTIMGWLRLHDEYEDAPAHAASCCA